MKKELIFAILAGLFWAIGLVSPTESVLGSAFSYKEICFIISIIFGGYYTVRETVRDLRKKKLTIDFLMLFAAVGAIILDKYGDAALLLFLFSLGHALENYALNRAKKSINDILGLISHSAIRSINGRLSEVPLEEIMIGDTVYVKPNTKIPVDGYLCKGTSHVNQAPITGESIPVKKVPIDQINIKSFSQTLDLHKVYAGTINGNEGIEVKVAFTSEDSTISRLIRLIKDAESQKSPTQHMAESFEKYYVPIVIGVVILLMFAFVMINETFSESFYRAMAVLIAASPCALALSTPSAVLAGISRAAKRGIIIKGGKPLEDIGNIRAIAFDKTGTLTEGRPELTHMIPFNELSKESLAKMVYAVEQGSDHPLAVAIAAGIKKSYPTIVENERAENIEAIIGGGVEAIYNDDKIFIGNKRSVESFSKKRLPNGINDRLTKLQKEGNTAMLIYYKNNYVGIISVMDTPRPEASTAITIIKSKLEKLILLSGDNQKVVDSVAKTVGIDDALGNQLPEDKVDAIQKLIQTYGKVAMIGDGVNDAPAMATSTVSISMRAIGSDVALETADIALMTNNLNNIPFTINLSQQTKKIIKQNIWISMGMVCILVPLTLLGIASIGPAVVAHEGSTVFVVINALRLLRIKID